MTDISSLKMASTIASLGNMLGGVQTKDQELAWKKRMMKASWIGMGLEWPKDFDALSGTEQLKRLNQMIAVNLEKNPEKVSDILKEKK